MRVETGEVRVRRREAWRVRLTLTKAQRVVEGNLGFIPRESRGGEQRRECPGPKETPAILPSGPSSGVRVRRLESVRVGDASSCPSVLWTTTSMTAALRITRHALDVSLRRGGIVPCGIEKKQEKSFV